MMDLASGVSVVSVPAVRKQIKHWAGEKRTDIFTPSEKRYCQSKRHSAEHYAARLAAKEACLKALGLELEDSLLGKIEVTRRPSGQPGLKIDPSLLKGSPWRDADVHVSLAHEREAAIAFVLLSKFHAAKPSHR